MIAENTRAVRSRIQAACRRAGRDESDVKLIAVSKTHSANLVGEALASGLNAFGENKVQEAEVKIPALAGEAAEWHLIGHLQSNKARKAVALFDVIQSLDSLELAELLERICDEERRATLPVLVQIDLAGERSKSGVTEEDLPEIATFLSACKHLRFDGLMLLPPYFDDAERARPFFKRLRTIRDAILPKGALSMGMSHDFEVAIEEGATIVRVGTAIFGERDR